MVKLGGHKRIKTLVVVLVNIILIVGLIVVMGLYYKNSYQVTGTMGEEYAVNVINREYFFLSILILLELMFVDCAVLYSMNSRLQEAVYKERESNDHWMQQMELVQSLSRIYFSGYFIDVRKDKYKLVDSHKAFPIPYGEEESAREMLERIIRTTVSEQHIERMLEFVDLDIVSARLTDEDVVSREYMARGLGWCRASMIVVNRNREGIAEQLLFVCQHIDAEKQRELDTQEELKKAYEGARDANRAKTDFLSAMSHDIRTPLNGIMGMTQIAKHNLHDIRKVEESLDKIYLASTHLHMLVKDVLDMSKLESGKEELHKEPFLIRNLIRSCEAWVMEGMNSKGITFVLDDTGVEHPNLLGSVLHIKRLLLNILSNAMKYNKVNGEIFVEVLEIASDQENATFRFTIADTGIGMSEEFLTLLYEPFTQEAIGKRGEMDGSGLGMAIVKRLVDLMGGTVQVHSEVGVGTTFVIELTFQIDKTIKKRQNDRPLNLKKLEGKRVLLVEDLEMNLEIAQNALEEFGLIVDTAMDGQEAVERFAASAIHSYCAIFMDIQMPVMDGYEATRAIRALEREDASKIPIFAMTANTFVEDKEMALEAGMNDHLAKPFDFRKIMEMLFAYVV